MLRLNLHSGHWTYLVVLIDSTVPHKSQNIKSRAWEYAISSPCFSIQLIIRRRRKKCIVISTKIKSFLLEFFYGPPNFLHMTRTRQFACRARVVSYAYGHGVRRGHGCPRILPFFFYSRTRGGEGKKKKNTKNPNLKRCLFWVSQNQFLHSHSLSVSRRSSLALLLLLLSVGELISRSLPTSSVSSKYDLTYFTVFPFCPHLGIGYFWRCKPSMPARCFILYIYIYIFLEVVYVYT